MCRAERERRRFYLWNNNNNRAARSPCLWLRDRPPPPHRRGEITANRRWRLRASGSRWSFAFDPVSHWKRCRVHGQVRVSGGSSCHCFRSSRSSFQLERCAGASRLCVFAAPSARVCFPMKINTFGPFHPSLRSPGFSAEAAGCPGLAQLASVQRASLVGRTVRLWSHCLGNRCRGDRGVCLGGEAMLLFCIILALFQLISDSDKHGATSRC